MSLHGVRDFTEALLADGELQRELAAAVDGKEEAAAIAAVSALGARHGFDFSIDEASRTRRAIAAMGADADSQELDEAELEMVAGGVSWWRQVLDGPPPAPLLHVFNGW